ncbi:hypothetical protein NBM05_03915 [Rothia sp. AR01]|uniref:Uncharacterized protein n=1 Tax=Rothia santali TaxID=2949643 RepID=A0A9X2HHX4_9MICC|nr:hypothetical protein [Rothia santali]MCP3425193.1 hypothetical protein [Rothia santali]
MWFDATGIGGHYLGKIFEVSSESATDRLPESAESTQVAEAASAFSDSDAVPAILVFEREDSLEASDQEFASTAG